MSLLLIPIAPLYRSKSRLENYLSRNQLKELTIAMFKDLGNTLLNIKCFSEKIVYCESEEILKLAGEYDLVGIKEYPKNPSLSFDGMITNLDRLIIDRYDPESTVIAFLDLVLISAQNFLEINSLMKTNNLVVCPAIQSAGISVLGRKPPDLLDSYFSHPKVPSLIALFNAANEKGIEKIAIYDSFRASFDVDIMKDLMLAYEYLKIFNLEETETYKFLKKNLKLSIHKTMENNNREFAITDKKI
ncbi:MAG: hypothetical protein ACFFBP_19510 [Promethearchaeota archaeon]